MTNLNRTTTIAQSEMRAINRSAVLEYLRLARQASRTELAIHLNISKPTTMRIIEELMANHFVYAVGQREGGLGRNQELLALNTEENLTIGIDLGGSHISGGIITIGGEILFQSRQEISWMDPDTNFDHIVAFIQSMIQKGAEFQGRLLGVAIGVPGIVQNDTGVVVLAPSLNWRDYPLIEKMQPLIALPLIIENDVNMAALGEQWFGAGVGVNNLVLIAVGTGIGAGIILDGKLYRGFRNSSGEIGYLLPDVQSLNNRYPGFGALESLASGKGIADRAALLWQQLYPDKAMPAFTMTSILQAVDQGEPWAKTVFDQTLDYLSLAVANVSACFDPELIILGGGVSQPIQPYVNRITERIKNVIPIVPRILVSSLGGNAPLLGAATRVFQKVTEYVTIQTI